MKLNIFTFKAYKFHIVDYSSTIWSEINISSTKCCPLQSCVINRGEKMPSNIKQSSAKNRAMENVTRDFPSPWNGSIQERKIEFIDRFWIFRFNMVKMAIFPKWIYIFKHKPHQNPSLLFFRIWKLILKSNCNVKNIKWPNNLEKEQSWRSHTSCFKTYYKAIVIKIIWYWHKDRQVN